MLLSMLITLIASACITGLLGLGCYLIWSGICGKIVDGHPLCGNCNFDLVGHSPRPLRCPECGATIARSGGIKIGHREQHLPKILHGSVLIAINLSIIGFCWWTAERSATSARTAIAPTLRNASIPVVTYTNAQVLTKYKEATNVATILNQDSIDAITHDSPITLSDASAKTIALNVETQFSGSSIIFGGHNRGANLINLNQLLLFDKQSKMGLPAQPASGVIESLRRPVVIGKPFKLIDRSKNKAYSGSYKFSSGDIKMKSNSNSRVSRVNASPRMDTNKIKAQRAEQNALGQYNPYNNKGINHGTARKNLSHRGR